MENEDESLDGKEKRDKKKKEDKKKGKRRKRSHHRRRSSSSSEEEEEDSSGSSSLLSDDDPRRKKSRSDSKDAATSSNPKLLAKLQARGETLEERRKRRSAKAELKRAAYITTKFGYTAEDNPFHDPNLHQPFLWKKKQNQKSDVTTTDTLQEIEKLRHRRKQREQQMEEMDRIRREESRMKELENFDDWARKEEEFHLQQQRQRSAIRIVQGREKPIDILAKNMLMFGGALRENRAKVKYKERYNAFEDLCRNLDVQIEEPHKFLHMLKLHELEQVLVDIDAFLTLEREAATQENSENDKYSSLEYWKALKVVTLDEIKLLKSGGNQGSHAKMVEEVTKIFKQGQSIAQLQEMRSQVLDKIRSCKEQEEHEKYQQYSFDAGSADYWMFVLEQLDVNLAKRTLSQIHSEMLVRQLERLEQRREELAKLPPEHREQERATEQQRSGDQNQGSKTAAAESSEKVEGDDFSDVEEQELAEEVQEWEKPRAYSWSDKYRPRKPRYFNRVKTGYDWNQYNRAHYDRENPPPKTVQGYKFNIFYPDLIDPSKTPQYQLLKADSDDYCIIRFTAGPPYEDVAFKIVNKEWNKSRKHGFKSTFERGILSLYFNFKTAWYRR